MKPELKLKKLHDLVALYMVSEGCTCCEGEEHEGIGHEICNLLGFRPYEDGSGYDYHEVVKALEERSL